MNYIVSSEQCLSTEKGLRVSDNILGLFDQWSVFF